MEREAGAERGRMGTAGARAGPAWRGQRRDHSY